MPWLLFPATDGKDDFGHICEHKEAKTMVRQVPHMCVIDIIYALLLINGCNW